MSTDKTTVSVVEMYTAFLVSIPMDVVSKAQCFAKQFFACPATRSDHRFDIIGVVAESAEVWVGLPTSTRLCLLPEFCQALATHLGVSYIDQRQSGSTRFQPTVPVATQG